MKRPEICSENVSPLRISAPFTDETAGSLIVGQQVLVSGEILAARDAAHQKLVGLLEAGEPLPVDLRGQVVYYVGPTPARPGHVVGSAGPTTSGRMDPFTPQLLAHGLKGMIGKGYRNEAVKQAIRDYCAPYLVATGGAGALLARHIVEYRILAWPELGAEALAQMKIRDFPALVVLDAHGGDFYRTAQDKWRRQS